jgi:hypothetical protein
VRPSRAALAVAYGRLPGTARRAWCEETLTIAPSDPAARNRWIAVAHPHDGRIEVQGDQVQHLAGGCRVDRRVTKHSRVVHPPDKRPRSLREIGCPLRNGLVRRIADDSRCAITGGVIVQPSQRRRVELESDHITAVPEQVLDQSSADTAAAARHHVGTAHAVFYQPEIPSAGRADCRLSFPMEGAKLRSTGSSGGSPSVHRQVNLGAALGRPTRRAWHIDVAPSRA